ncbi:MAG: ATP-dependent 6-phosphofructokinase, partial [Thermotogae bacterium]
GDHCTMMALELGKIVHVPLKEVIENKKTLDMSLYNLAYQLS